jgi:hypothetical protein
VPLLDELPISTQLLDFRTGMRSHVGGTYLLTKSKAKQVWVPNMPLVNDRLILYDNLMSLAGSTSTKTGCKSPSFCTLY